GRGDSAVDRLGRRGRLAPHRWCHSMMLGRVGADLVEGAGGDPGAAAQPRHQFAVVDDEPAEGGFGGLRGATKIPDFAENLVGGSDGDTILVFPGPHGDLPAVCPLPPSRDSRQVASTTNGVGNDRGHTPTVFRLNRAPAIAAGGCRAASPGAPRKPASPTGWPHGGRPPAAP